MVRNNISTTCLGNSDSHELLHDADYLAFWKSFVDLSAHIFDVLADLSEYESLWSWYEFRTHLQQQNVSLTECANGSEVGVDL